MAACQAIPPAKSPVTLPTPPGTRLSYLVPVGWHAAHVVQTVQLRSIEYVPAGQSRQQWTDMVTAAWIERAIYHRLGDMSATLHATLEQNCAIAPVYGEPQYITGAAYDATLETIACGRNPEGFGFVAMIRTLKTDAGYYQLQCAWRRAPVANSHALALSDRDRQIGTAILNTLEVIPGAGAGASQNP